MTVLSSSYGIIMDRSINVPGDGKNVVNGLNGMDKRYLKGERELGGKLASNDTSNIVILPSASKEVFVKVSDQCIHILDNKVILNGLKGSTKMQNRQYLFKYH